MSTREHDRPPPVSEPISTAAGSVKARNIMKSPEVSPALEDGRYPVVAEGTARIHDEGFPA